jgi:hypothetical protein
MRNILLSLGAIAILSGTPALAQGGMKTKPMTGMSMADMKQMNMCMGMSRDKMMKNTACMKMMKMHPEMMKMSAAEMKTMRSCMAMSGDKMMKTAMCSNMMKKYPTMMKPVA